MHELSIVYGIISAVSEAAERSGARRVKTVTLRLGALAGVVQEALLFGYDAVTPGTPLEGSELVIRPQPVVIHCDSCRCDRELPGILSFRCPVCHSPSAKILQGRELDIESFEVETEEEVCNEHHANR